MKIAYLIAGAGEMYCGSCLRDHRLAATLIEQGRDVMMVPLYTPIHTDDPLREGGTPLREGGTPLREGGTPLRGDRIASNNQHIYYGGINVYLRSKSALFRALPGRLVGWLDAPTLLRWAMRRMRTTSPAVLGRLTVSVLKGETGAQRKELEKLIKDLRTIRPDLVHLPNLMFVGVARAVKEALNVPVMCSLTGEDVFLDPLPQPHRQEALELIRERARDVDRFVAVTRYYAAHAIQHFGLPSDRVEVVPMGIRVDDFAPSSPPPDGPITIGYLARVCPEKGLADLCEALVILRRMGKETQPPCKGHCPPARGCRVRAAGSLSPSDQDYLRAIHRRLAEQGHKDAFEYVGQVSRAEKIAFLQSLHIFCVPAPYHEAKGLYLLEAMAAGVPIVQPNRGAFPEIVQATGGGVLYDPTAPNALADALASLMADPDRRRELGQQGRSAVEELFTDKIMAQQTWALYNKISRAAGFDAVGGS